MKLNLSVDEVLSTTRSVRRRLDVSKPVPRTEIEACLELALQAPNGANRNQWRWIVIDDRTLIAKLAGIYRELMADHLKALMGDQLNDIAELRPAPDDIPRQKEMLDSSAHLVDILDSMPAILIPLLEGRFDGRPCVDQASMWARSFKRYGAFSWRYASAASGVRGPRLRSSARNKSRTCSAFPTINIPRSASFRLRTQSASISRKRGVNPYLRF
jgi:hypothetical protein